jgi:arylsulfatase A-like enzyme
MRVPCIVRWPGQVPAGATCDEITTTMDLLPTFARLAGAAAPQDRILDGRDVWPLLSGQPGATSPHEAFCYYYMDQLQAIRSGQWKLHLASDAKRANLKGDTTAAQAELYDLVADIGETHNVAADHPEVVQRLLRLAEAARQGLGDGDRAGKNQRPAGRVLNPVAQVQRD